MNFFKNNWKVLITISIIAFLFPIIILYPSNYGVIPHNVGLEIVSYGGSILGGFLTLYGVWWTIHNQEKQRYQDLAIQYKPYLLINIISEVDIKLINSHIDDYYKNISGILAVNLHNNLSDYCYTLEFEIENIGNGECYIECVDDININKNYEYSFLTNKDFEYSPHLNSSAMIEKQWKDVVPRKNKIKILLQIIYNFNDMSEHKTVDVEIPFIYYDQFKINKYDAKLKIRFASHYIDDKKILTISEYNMSNDLIT